MVGNHSLHSDRVAAHKNTDFLLKVNTKLQQNGIQEYVQIIFCHELPQLEYDCIFGCYFLVLYKCSTIST